MTKIKATTVTGYIAAATPAARAHLRELRSILKTIAPKAKETLKWGSPVFEDTRILFAYAAFRLHINFMPTPSVLEVFRKESAPFKTGKGSIQFPHDRPLPAGLIRRMAALRLKELKENDARWM